MTVPIPEPANEPIDPRPRIDKDVFRQVIGHFASGVTVVTALHGGRRFGMTASAITSLSLEPPMLLVCINRQAPTRAAISASGAFGVNILGEDDVHLAEHFAVPRDDKFTSVDVEAGRLGVPMLRHALARLECRVTEDVQGGTHSVFLGLVERAEARRGSPLAYFRGRFGRLDLAEDEAIYDRLRERVLSGQLQPGEPVDVARLARDLRSERWHVHHALTKLVAEGLVERGPELGYAIRPVDLRTVNDALNGRRAIELGVAEVSVGLTSELEINELRRRMEATLPLVRGGRFTDLDRYTAANAAFHEYMVGLARSDALIRAYRRLTIPAIMARTLRQSDLAEDGLRDDHRALVDAYERGDPVLARMMIERHTERSKRIHRRAFESAATDA